MNNTNKTENRRTTVLKTLTKIAILSAVAMVLMLFEFPLWFAPPFYKLDLGDVAVLIGGFALGPLAGACIMLLKVLLNMLFTGTITGGVGEFANFVIGCSFVLPAAILYMRNKTFKTAVLGMILGTVSLCVVGSAMNYFLLLPVYAKVFGMPIESLVAMGTAVNKNIVDLKTFVLLAVVPFNFTKGVLSSILAILIYKRVSPILHK